MVQSLGISIGNQNSYVAAGQGGGVEILLNEYSNRSTPSMIAFTENSRSLGGDAASNFFMNMKNTIYDIMVLMGKTYEEQPPEVKDEAKPKYPFKIEPAPTAETTVVVNHLGSVKAFNTTQLLAMLFTKLRGIASDATDCVISYPQFFNEAQKRDLVKAAKVAGLKPLEIISDMSAIILNYAYYRTTKEDTHKFIAFVDFGQSNLQTAIAWLSPKDDLVRILASDYELIGGKDFDAVLADHFVKEQNLELSQKQYLKLVASCEKLKKNLSVNTIEMPISIESLISEDKDFSGRIDRAKFEDLSQHILQRVGACLRRTLDAAKKNFDAMIGEIRQQAEAAEVARAHESNTAAEAAKNAEAAKANKAQVIKDAAERAAAEKANKVDGEAQSNGENSAKGGDDKEKSEEAGKGSCPMDAEPEEVTKATAAEAKATQLAKDAKLAEKVMASQANRMRKLAETKFDLQIVEVVGGSTRIPAVKQLINNVFEISPSTTLNTDEAVVRGCVLHCAAIHPGMKVKREVKILGSDPFFRTDSVEVDHDDVLRTVELRLIDTDRKYRSRAEARNNLEEYIYIERSKFKEGDQILDQFNQTLDWLLSDEGDEAPEDEYNKKMSELKKLSEATLSQNNNTPSVKDGKPDSTIE